MLQGVIAPQSMSELGQALSSDTGQTVIAGGTMIMPVINGGQHATIRLVSLRRMGLSGISAASGTVTIGAATPISALARHPDLAFLHAAIDSIASPTVRNMATVGGNLFAAAPYGDLAVCLIALGAMATIAGAGGERTVVSVEALTTGSLQTGEIVVKVAFALPVAGTFRYRKAARRALNSASIVTVAAVVPVSDGLVKGCRVSLGGVAPRPVRAAAVEALIEGRPLTRATVEAAAAAAKADIHPASDAYASAWYRARVTPVHIRRAILGE